MSALRQLSVIYLAAASSYGVAIALSDNPDLARRSNEAGAYVAARSAEAATALNRDIVQPGLRGATKEAQTLGRQAMEALQSYRGGQQAETRVAANAKPRVRAARAWHDEPPYRFSPPAIWTVAPPEPKVADNATSAPIPVPRPRPEIVAGATSDRGAAAVNPPTAAAPPEPQLANAIPHLVPPPDVPQSANSQVPPQEITRVAERLKANLTGEMLDNFGLFLYISKASAGPWSQHMYVFRKEDSGDLALLYNWPVSTGRERVEYNAAGLRLPSYTPAGYYELDPNRLYRTYHSHQWGEAMPYSMFFNWVKRGHLTGLAIHSATGSDVDLLGQRASAGCVRLPPDAARTLFTLIRSEYRGLAPRFALNRRTGTMSNDGILLHDADGHVRLSEGYRVLVFIENYGGENVVAALF